MILNFVMIFGFKISLSKMLVLVANSKFMIQVQKCFHLSRFLSFQKPESLFCKEKWKDRMEMSVPKRKPITVLEITIGML